MLRPRILWKLYASYLILLVLTTLIVGVVIARQIAQETQHSTEEALHAQAILLKATALSALTQPGNTSLRSHVKDLGQATHTHLTIIRRDGMVMLDSEMPSEAFENQSERPEIVSATPEQAGVDIRISPQQGLSTLYVALPIQNGDDLLGYIRTARPLTTLNTRLTRFYTILAWAAAGAALLGLLVSIFFSRRLTRPLMAMTEVATSLTGDASAPASTSQTKDELATFTDAFNRMAQRLRNRMETVIKERNQLLAVLSGMVEGVVAVDEEECVVHMNQAAGIILNATPEASIGKPLWEVTRVRAVTETINSTIHDEEEISCDARIVTPPRDRRLKLNAAPLRDGQGKLVGAVMVLHDVTEIRRLENVRRDFVSNVSHELKTPITTIKGFVETLRDGAVEEPEQADRFLGIVARNADRLHAIIEDLLSLSRLEQSEETAELVTAPEHLHMVLENAIQDCASKAAARHITLHTECDPSTQLSINAPLVRQAIVNLVDNAINYSKPGGSVWLHATNGTPTVTIEVRDEGVGIPQDDLPRLFERFYRVDKARSREHGGTGLGLAIVKHIAQVHGGKVAVTSTLGKGSTFTLQLPNADFGMRN